MRKESTKYKNYVFTVWPLIGYADCMFCDIRFMWEIGYGWGSGFSGDDHHCSYSCSSCSNSLKDFDEKVSTCLKNSRPKITPKAPPARSK